jgi:hypothetical protein
MNYFLVLKTYLHNKHFLVKVETGTLSSGERKETPVLLGFLRKN